MNVAPIYVASLKDPFGDALVRELVTTAAPDVVLNATGFSLAAPGADPADSPFGAADCPVLQIVFSGGNEEIWQSGTRGLGARDIAMNVALPEVDGRILGRAVSFKGRRERDELTQSNIVEYAPV
ncbi:MAG: cobaltochelatase subunit CobN, partial [Pirellulaceae bacterium]|nr:cobaltochelatase subunit CobN [Pirellulaceae bacterium]